VAGNGAIALASGASVAGTLAPSDIDSPALTCSLLTTGTKGVAALTNQATGAFTYAAATTATGTDTFTLVVSVGALTSNVATVTVTISGGNQPPMASNGTLTTPEDRSARSALL